MMRKRFTVRHFAGLTVIVAVATVVFGVTVASGEVSPSKVTSTSTTLYWSGQGTPVHQECGTSADAGAGGFQNSGTASNYFLWIFSTDGGSANPSPTLTINGTNYNNVYFTGGVWQMVTPAIDVSTITDAHTNFSVADPGGGDWILTISHGCGGGTTPPATDLTATKTAVPTFTRDYDWSVAKTQTTSSTPINSAASSVNVSYRVTATWSGPVDSGWAVTGTITVLNPNPAAVPGVSVSGDVITDSSNAPDANASCTPEAGTKTIPAGGSNTFSYSCSYSGAPATTSETNTATVSWPTETLSDGSNLTAGTTQATHAIDWSTPTTVNHATTTVSDNFNGGGAQALGVAGVDGSWTTDAGNTLNPFGEVYDPLTNTFTLTYARSVPVVVNTCTTYPNTATVSSDGTLGDNSSSASVTVCGRVTGGLTIGFWSNKNGKAVLCANNPLWRNLLNGAPYTAGTYLRNANGTLYTVPVPPAGCATADASYSAWLLNATATNMSYMLSAQLSATILNVNFNGMPGGACIAGTDGNPITINNVISGAIAFLKANGNTTASGPARTLATAYKNIFDGLNNGNVFSVPGCV